MPSSGWSAVTGARRGSGQSTAQHAWTGSPGGYDPVALIDLLDLHPGQRVLEIGRGVLRHTAALAERVGARGEVVSITPAGDDAAYGSYDRLVAWAALPALPLHWIEHLAPRGVAVAALPVAPLAAADVATRVELTDDGLPTVTSVVPDALLRVPDTVLGVPEHFVDAAVRMGGEPWWVSAEWLHGRQEHDAVEVLAMLRDSRRHRPDPLTSTENERDLVGYLLASRPDGMLTAGLGGSDAGIGCALPGSVAALCGNQLVTGGTDEAVAGLLDWIEEWRSSGRPGLRAFRPHMQRRNAAWELRFERF